MEYLPIDVSQYRSSAPAWVYSATEPARSAVEVATTVTLLPWLLQEPAGDGHTVMLLPGYAASDWSTVPMSRYLQRLGYQAYGWSLGRNTGQLELRKPLLSAFFKRSEQAGAPMTLIGQSLGGVFARELARSFPERVRQVISLGSPFGHRGGRPSNPLVRHLFKQLAQRTAGQNSARPAPALQARSDSGADPAEPPPVPCTAIYSRFDGVVPWQSCIERDRPNTCNIEVFSSHIGMAVHPAILHAVADRLAQAPQQWQRFDRAQSLRAIAYPEPRYAAG